MYARCQYPAGVTVNDIQADLVSLLTGEINLNNLIAFDPVNSEINTSVRAAGWEVYDAWTTGKTVLRAPISDVPGVYKYLLLDSATTSTLIRIYGYTAWDAVTHTGLNRTHENASSLNFTHIDPSTALGGVIYISASANHAIFYNEVSGNFYGPYGITERSRRGGWDTSANNIPNFGVFYIFNKNTIDSTSSTLMHAQEYNPKTNVLEVSTNNNAQELKTLFGSGGSIYPYTTSTSRKDDFTIGYELFDLFLSSSSKHHAGGSISEKADVWVGPLDVGVAGDTLVKDGETYIMVGKANNTLFVRYG